MYQSVNFNDIETSQKICSNNSSTVVAINADFLGMETVECSNRKIYSLSYK